MDHGNDGMWKTLRVYTQSFHNSDGVTNIPTIPTISFPTEEKKRNKKFYLGGSIFEYHGGSIFDCHYDSGMGRQGIRVYSRGLKYRNQSFRLPDNTTHSILVGQEKGIDIRIALDVVRSARKNLCDGIVIFSQDQDLSEVADEIRTIAKDHNRWIKVVSAFPFSPTTRNRRGINHTDWFRIDRKMYDVCIDSRDYRPKK